MPDMNAKRIEKLEFETEATDRNLDDIWKSIKELNNDIEMIWEKMQKLEEIIVLHTMKEAKK